ncbi:hypothetical protein EV126DRAFT_87905 [Verticillium dahliae]|nr:hypothetical protein EV126DRAFT_87905 [Verticillium dahliae]
MGSKTEHFFRYHRLWAMWYLIAALLPAAYSSAYWYAEHRGGIYPSRLANDLCFWSFYIPIAHVARLVADLASKTKISHNSPHRRNE